MIQEIQRKAVAGKFDVLLVFMFDRLGRREDEAPFVEEWFVKNNIEVCVRYDCHYNIRHPGECGGQSGYGVTKLDALVSKIVRTQFEKIKAVCAQDLIAGQQAKQIELAKANLKLANNQYQERKRK